MKKVVALFLSLAMVLSMAGCGKEQKVQQFTGDFTYKDSVSLLASYWNPHDYETADDNYLTEFIRCGLYEFVFNDEIHPVEGKEPFTGYKVIPSMAAAMPVDVTEQMKADHPEFNIPESATEGFAYVIDLNPNAKWEDGTPINADSYIYSMKELLNPEMLNYRATDYYAQSFSIAGAEAYANSGHSVNKALSTDGETMEFPFADLVKGADGNYTTPDGYPAFFGLTEGYAWMGGDSLEAYSAYIDPADWAVLEAAANEEGFAPVNEETITALYNFIGSDIWGNEPEENLGYYVSYAYTYPEASFDNVGLLKTGDYQITLVLAKSLAGFDLLYNLSGPTWLVYEDLYESCKKQDGDAWFTTYNTSVETTMSYGPYKLVEFQKDKALRLVKNENWFGYTDGQHIYVDPTDGLTYPMYQTTEITCEVVPEAATRKMMFLKGNLMTYGLQKEDFATYRGSEFAYVTPGDTLFFMIFNGHKDAIQNREKNDGFDTAKYDLETMTVKSFRQAVAVTYDKELFASTISPSRSGGYGLIGTKYVYDPETGAKYRETEQAKQTLCDFYSVDVSAYKNLDEAVASITGYDPETAKVLYKQAFEESLAAGYITDADGDGKSDQTVRIEYCMGEDSDFMTQTINYLNEKMAEVTVGTPFEGKIEFVKSAVYGNEWSTKLKSGMSDIVLAGWQGSALDPFGLTELYTNPAYQYDAEWFDATSVKLTQKIGEEEVTMNLSEWSLALNGETVTVGGKEYNFGSGAADVETRLTILAAIEGAVLQTYDYIPMLQDAGMSLLSQQCYYVIEDYSPVMGRGGIAYLKYNYDNAAWAEFVASQGGEVKY